jgi:hypothetical protein
MAASISSITAEGVLATLSGAGVAFVTLSHTNKVTQPGMYRIRAYVSLYGSAPTSADANNVELVIGSNIQILPIPAVVGAGIPYTFMVQLDGSTDVVLQSATAGPSVATYSGMLVADFLGRNGQLAKYLPN